MNLPIDLGSLIYKIALIAIGFLVILIFGGSTLSIFILLTIATAGFFTSKLIAIHGSSTLRKWVSLISVPLCFIVLVTLNMTGWIGTLTGTGDITQNFALLIAAPFYFLSIAAYFSEVTSHKRLSAPYIDFLLYISLPFKLLAGPLEQPNLLDQINKLKLKARTSSILISWPWIVLGAFMKFVIANRLNPSKNLDLIDPISALLVGAIFELKFYFDFAGYSFIAYGLAQAIGLKINHNFAHPFFAKNVVVFWRQWHISLGRFLTRYILEPNLKFLKTRNAKEVFASGIFIISAMWHGGTINYLIWGLFHATCYYIFIKYIKHLTIPKALAIFSMVIFFIIGRFLATDSNSNRLLTKILNIINPTRYIEYFQDFHLSYQFEISEIKAIGLCLIFFLLEYYSIKNYSKVSPYHFFRKPLVSLIMLCVVLVSATQSGNLLYARI